MNNPMTSDIFVQEKDGTIRKMTQAEAEAQGAVLTEPTRMPEKKPAPPATPEQAGTTEEEAI